LKFRVECKSLLLQKALEEFLKEYISEDGLIVSDENGDIIIGKDIKKPFSKSQLLLQLENIWNRQNSNKKIEDIEKKEDLEIDMSVFDDLMQKEVKSENFDEKLDLLIEEFKDNLKKLIKEEYGQK
jgi:histone H3/H4